MGLESLESLVGFNRSIRDRTTLKEPKGPRNRSVGLNGDIRYYDTGAKDYELLSPEDVDCPDCLAGIEERCLNDEGQPRRFYHRGRTLAAREG